MNFQPLKDFMDGYLPMLGVPGTDIVIYKDHEEIFRYQSGYDSIKFGTPVNPNSFTYTFCQGGFIVHINKLILQRGTSCINNENFHICNLRVIKKP